jgi:hypothetical protein
VHIYIYIYIYTYVKLCVVKLVNIVNTCMFGMCGEVRDPNQRILDINYINIFCMILIQKCSESSTNLSFNTVDKSTLQIYYIYVPQKWYVIDLVVRVMVFNASFNNILVGVFLVEKTGTPAENHRPAASYWPILSHNIVSNIPRHKQDSNSQR